jgi:glycerol kinase
VPRSLLPEVKDCAADYGVTDRKLLGRKFPIGGVAGDQQAATIGQACFEPGMMKSTYGTGCFALLNTGEKAVPSRNRLLTTVAYQLNGKRTYALEGAIFIAGAAVQWLRDGLKIIKSASETGRLQKAPTRRNRSISFPPSLASVHPIGMQRPVAPFSASPAAPATGNWPRAALEAVCYQTRDLLEAMQKDWGSSGSTVLRVDGGMTRRTGPCKTSPTFWMRPWTGRRCWKQRPLVPPIWQACRQVSCHRLRKFATRWSRDKRFSPKMKPALREMKYAGWKDAVRKLLA